ncbi:MAG: leucine-rich repeat protein [Agathobacter sp.]|nr:leucine-rich repeat protein [Agathobacter sp.]
MFKRNKSKGFSLVEILVTLGIMAVLIAVLTPFLINHVEESKREKDVAGTNELVNAVSLATSNDAIVDEIYEHYIENNYITYSDSSGQYGNPMKDEEYWAPDGAGPAITITFNPVDGEYIIEKGIINDMTFGNGSKGESRKADGDLTQYYLRNVTGLYHAIRTVMGDKVEIGSRTYENSSYTVFITFEIIGGEERVNVYGSYNGTNLQIDSPSAKGTHTTEYNTNGDPEIKVPGGWYEYNEDDVGVSDLIPTPTTPPPGEEEVEETLPDYKYDALINNPKIPAGGKYVQGSKTYTAGQKFPEIQLGDVYTYGVYKYTYEADGWQVSLNLSATSKDKATYPVILEIVNKRPIRLMNNTFEGCVNLTQSPKIPETVVSMSGTYAGCTSLSNTPTIPYSVVNMTSTFQGCTALVLAPQLPESLTTMNGTFEGCTALKEAPKIPLKVKSMSATFKGCTKITEAPVLPNGVTNLFNTFRDCSALVTAPVIPTTATNTGGMLAWCKSLKTYTGSTGSAGDFSGYVIPNSVTTVTAMFNGCSLLTLPPKMPQNINNMDYVFDSCAKLTTAPVIPNGVTSMSHTFSGCSSLKTYIGSSSGNGNFTEYVLPNNITNMDYAFQNTQLVQPPKLPNKTNSMEATFANCKRLLSIGQIPSGVNNMKETFLNCSLLSGMITIESNPGSYKDCFKGTVEEIVLTGGSSKLYDIRENRANIVVAQSQSGGGVSGVVPLGGVYYDNSAAKTLTSGQTIPAIGDGDIFTYGDYQYTYYASGNANNAAGWSVSLNMDATDRNRTSYGSILSTISNQPVTSMYQTFANCTALTTAPAIPSSVRNMYYTFQGCTALTSAGSLPSGITSLQGTFYGCSKLSTAPTIPSSVTNLTSAFENSGLTKMPTIPSSVTNMTKTFMGCTKLTTTTTLPASVTNMSYTFSGCTALTTAPAISPNVTNISYAFQNCTKLTSTPTFGVRVANMSYAFSGCSNLTTVQTLPASVTNMRAAFSGCIKLATAPTIPANVTDLASAFSGCSALTAAPSIPSKVQNLESTFKGCVKITSMPSIPSSVTNMSNTFEGCSALKTATTIPSSVVYMNATFKDCVNLTGTITIHASPNTYTNCFAGTTKNITLTGNSSKLNQIREGRTNISVG